MGTMESFAERLAKALKLRERTEADLAKKLGISQQAINNWKQGKNKSKRMYEVAEELNIRPEWLIRNEGPMEGDNKLDPEMEKSILALGQQQREALAAFIKSLKGIKSNGD